MKIEKNKIVFISVILVIIAFLVSYYLLVISNQEESDMLEQTTIPVLDEDQKTYDSKLDAINDLKEVLQTNAPSIYDEKLIDSLGYYDPKLPDKKKERIIDSIYDLGSSRYAALNSSIAQKEKQETPVIKEVEAVEILSVHNTNAKELGLEHQLFFASDPKENDFNFSGADATEQEIPVVVDGTQVVKANSRIRMRLVRTTTIADREIPKNTPVYGFISFQPNRVLIKIENINHHSTSLKAFDLQDGSEGIYVENNFRAEATTEVIDDLIGDVSIPGVPQVGGISKVLERRNRSVKVTVPNNYILILKPQL